MKKNEKVLLLCRVDSFLFDTGFLAGEVAQVVDSRTTDHTAFVHLDMVDVRRVERENTLDAYAVRYLADGDILVTPVPLTWITTPRKLCKRSLLPSTIL